MPANRRPRDISHFLRHRSDTEFITDAIANSGEKSRFTTLDDELSETRFRISNLEDTIKRIREEILDVVYPKYARFGFLSFIVFAILRVIVPMTYRIWATSLLDLSEDYPIITQYLDVSNSIVVMLFSIGLALTFCYIYFEVRPSLKSKIESTCSTDYNP